MLELLLLSSLCLPAQALPGQAFATPTAPTTLHAGPGQAHPGVLEVDTHDVLRIGDTRGEFVEVFVPQGFPVYLHGDFAELDAARQLVRPAGERLNVRLLPSTLGLLPIGQVGSASGELDLLGVEGSWVRVLAPVDLPLFAPASALQPMGAAEGRSRWDRAQAAREEQRQVAVRVHDATDPAFLEDLRVELHAELLARHDPASLDGAQLDELIEELTGLEGAATHAATRATVAGLAERARTERLQREQRAEAGARERTRLAAEAAGFEREARTLATGLRFLGKGDLVTITGRVSRRVTPDGSLSVFSIADERGRSFRLSAAPDLADLPALTEHTVTLEGRSLKLVNVGGPVLIIDQVVDVRP